MFNLKYIHEHQINYRFFKNQVRKGIIIVFLCTILPSSTQASNKGNLENNELENSSIKAIGTCAGITTAEENTYNITITGLDLAVIYNFDFDGDGVAEVSNFTGASAFTTSSENNTNINFIDGTVARIVQIDKNADGTYDTRITVHEVLCTDADNNGSLDFTFGCDKGVAAMERGYIVATTAPYNSTNIYVYLLTNTTDNALAANTSGLFSNLKNGTNGALFDYNVIALSFSTKTDALDFINGLNFDPITGTIVTPTSMLPTECSKICGIMAYNMECRMDDVALTKMVNTSNPDRFKIGDKITFDIEIFNQGTDPIFDIVVTDLFPKGYDFLTTNNTRNAFASVPADIIGGGIVTTSISGPIMPNSSQVVQIVMIINANANSQNLANSAEIIEARQSPNGLFIMDGDSDLSNQRPDIEGETDDEIANNPNDQDDFDFANIVFIESIPTMNEWGLFLFGLLILNLGVIMTSRKENLV